MVTVSAADWRSQIMKSEPKENDKVNSKCCKLRRVAAMDHVKIDNETLKPTETVNRYCLTCGRHWYGPAGSAKEYTQEEWDQTLRDAFSPQNI